MISVITCSIDAARLARFKTMLAATMGSYPWELTVIGDARSLAEGYTRGIAASHGEVLVFCHDDIEVLSPDFPQRLTGRLSEFDMIGVAGTSRLCNGVWFAAGVPYIFGQVIHPTNDNKFHVDIFGAPRRVVGNIQAMDGLMIAVRRSVLARIVFDAVTFDGFHLYDLDFSFSAYCAGFRLGIANDLTVLHRSFGSYQDTWSLYKERFERKWAARLAPASARTHKWALVTVGSVAEAMEIVNPPYWREEV